MSIGLGQLDNVFAGLYFTFGETPVGWRWAFALAHTYQTFTAMARIAFEGWAIPESSCADDVHCLVTRSGDAGSRSMPPLVPWCGSSSS